MRVKVWNDNTYDFTSKFKGDPIYIPAKGFIEMEFYEAHEFKVQYHPRKQLANGQEDPAFFKMIRVEPISSAAEESNVESHSCMKCKHVSPSSEELEAHLKVRHPNDLRLEDETLDAQISKKRGPGRPSKAETAPAA